MHFAKSLLLNGLAAPLLAGCNTIEGMGEDVAAVGNGGTHAAQYVEREMFGPQPRQVPSAQADTRNITYRNAQVSVGRACDANADTAGGEGLAPCRSRIVRPTPRDH